MRSSKMSRMCGSSAMSSTQGQSRCDLVFIFLMSDTRASSLSKRSRCSRARSALMARTGERKPSRWNACTCASVSTLGMALRLRLDEDRGVLRGLVAHVSRELGPQRPGLRKLQPESEHVALLMRFGAVHEARARVQDRVVVDELDVAGLEVHVQPEVRTARALVQVVERRLLERREGDAALHGAGVDLVADITAGHHAVLGAVDRDRPLGDAALGQRGLATDVVEAVVEQAEVLGMVGEDLVVHGD